uniref:Uncharacterized protein n=1 Tax=Tetranychus urticae TaxID=32264 RepID=T1K8H6_TETUR
MCNSQDLENPLILSQFPAVYIIHLGSQ